MFKRVCFLYDKIIMMFKVLDKLGELLVGNCGCCVLSVWLCNFYYLFWGVIGLENSGKKKKRIL